MVGFEPVKIRWCVETQISSLDDFFQSTKACRFLGTIGAFRKMFFEFHTTHKIELIIEVRVEEVALRVVSHFA